MQVIQSLWIGDHLRTLEQLSITSFLKNGHTYHLYAYDDIRGVPEGVVVKDANQILPRSMVYRQTRYDTPASFASLFRYKLLSDCGGWWVDTDVVCLKPFQFKANYVFASERHDSGAIQVTNDVIKAPRGSDFMKHCYHASLAIAGPELRWGELRRLLDQHVGESGLTGCILPYRVFNPVNFSEWQVLLDDGSEQRLGDYLAPAARRSLGQSLRAWFGQGGQRAEVHSVHIWHENWRRAGIDPDGRFAPTSLYEALKRRYLGT